MLNLSQSSRSLSSYLGVHSPVPRETFKKKRWVMHALLNVNAAVLHETVMEGSHNFEQAHKKQFW